MYNNFYFIFRSSAHAGALRHTSHMGLMICTRCVTICTTQVVMIGKGGAFDDIHD